MPTIKDVAKLSGVSVSTVSIILNGKSEERKISKSTQENVIEAIRELNYKPNISAKKLRSNDRHTYTIALYWATDFRPNLLGRFLEGVQTEILKNNSEYDIVICPYEFDKLWLEKGLKTANMYSAAIIVACSSADLDYIESINTMFPIVLVNRESEKYHTVCIDNFAAGGKAAELFFKKGYTKVGAIYFDEAYLAISSRNEGFIKSCIKNNIKIPDKFTFYTKNTVEGGVLAAEKLMQLTEKPKALYCDSDSIAMGVLYYFNKEGLKVPDDLEIISIALERSEITRYSTPPLTVVDVPLEKMSCACIKLINNALENNLKETEHILFDSNLIIRESCKL